MNRKQEHELEVFSAFAAESHLSVEPLSIKNAEPPAPDISCEIAHHGTWFFELAEVLWEDHSSSVVTLAHGFGLSKRASEKKAALTASGDGEAAEQIQTAGSFTYPPLASLFQALQKKCEKVHAYQTDDHPVSLLLYYERQNPIEPFERLTDTYYDILRTLLADSRFVDVWIYHHAAAYVIDFQTISNSPVRIPLRQFAIPETQRAVIGHILTNESSPLIFLDPTYGNRFQAASDLITRALANSSAPKPDTPE